MKKRLLNISGERIRGAVRQALSPAFLLILLGAALLWYTSKLSYEYNNEMPLNIRIDGEEYRFTAVVTGRGSAILARQLSLKRRLNFTLDELVSRPSRETPGALTITSASLMRAFNLKDKDLVISQVVEAPEFIPPPAPEPEVDESVGSDTDSAETPREKRKRERLERRQAKEEARAAEAEAEIEPEQDAE